MTFAKDRERIDEEQAGIARPAPRSLASSHLLQALNALDDACDAQAVLRPRRHWPLQFDDPPAAWRTLAGIKQRDFCCVATVFAAFAAEAYVNDFLDVHLRPQVSEREFATIDRWSTRRKYLEAVPRAYDRLFWEGDEVIPHLTSLFELRNQLAHPRPGIGPPMAAVPDPDWRSSYSPTQVAGRLIAVAGAGSSMEMRCYGFDYFSFPASLIWHGRTIVSRFAAQAEPLPQAEDEERPSLIEILNDELARQNAEHGDLRMTVHELRDARLKHAQANGPWDAFTQLVMRQETGSSED